MSQTKLSLLPGIIKLFPARVSSVSDIPAGDGKIANFFTVYINTTVADSKAGKTFVCRRRDSWRPFYVDAEIPGDLLCRRRDSWRPFCVDAEIHGDHFV
jgi:hypothetical protein